MPCDYPVFLDLAGRLAVVVGGGAVAARKVGKLLSAGARVRVVASRVGDAVRGHADAGDIELVAEPFSPGRLVGAFLVFACTDDPAVNSAVAAAARAAGSLVNSADDPPNCDFFLPAVSEHGQVKIAVSTGGSAPALAKFVRELLDDCLPTQLATLAEQLARVRPDIHRRLADPDARSAVWRRLCSQESIDRLRDSGLPGWQAWLDVLLPPAPAAPTGPAGSDGP